MSKPPTYNYSRLWLGEDYFLISISLATWSCAVTGTTGEMNKNDKIVYWQGSEEAGTLNFAGGTIKLKKKKEVFKSSFAISDKS